MVIHIILVGMANVASLAKCHNCGFEAPNGSTEWQKVTHPSLGDLTRCPECGSTNIYGKG